MPIKYEANTSAIKKELYPIIEEALNKSSTKT